MTCTEEDMQKGNSVEVNTVGKVSSKGESADMGWTRPAGQARHGRHWSRKSRVGVVARSEEESRRNPGESCPRSTTKHLLTT